MDKIGVNLVSVEKVPEEYRAVFCEFPYFNKIQSVVFDHVLNSDKPFVIAAPTGSGKTVIFELAIIRLLKQLDSFANSILPSTKIIYVAPMKALCEERYVDWYKKFNNFGLKCVAITGDSNQTFVDLLEYNIIITTPEKWDTITRKWRNHKKLVSSIKLFLIDEIHLINEEKRGATLETIVCRMKTIESFQYEDSSSLHMNGIRFVAASATIPNIEDIAQWIGSANNKAISYSFGEDTRPVKLNKIVYGYQAHNKNLFKFDIMLNYKLQPIILKYAEGKPTLIFCSTRKSVEMTTKYISQNITACMTLDQKSVLTNAAKIIIDKTCKEFLVHGVGYHHAGMLLETRRIIENLFRNGDLPILVTTSTLAIGVNLPAHLVIIKSTKYFTNGEYRDYNEGTVLQMIGRAGRPQFDTSATAVILTTVQDKMKYETMVERGQAIESNLHRHLIEHLNADICLKTVTDLGIALQWISSTFLYIRAKKSPKHYGFPVNLTDKELDSKLLEVCQIDINRLASAGMIIMDQMASISSTRLGYLMADHYIAFDTMKVFINIKGDEVLSQMMITLSKCQEFQELYIRTSDKKSLNLLNKNKNSECIRFPFHARINTAEMKVNCLIQAVFGCLQIIDHSLLNDATKIIRAGQRVTTCLTKYLETRQSNCFTALLNSYILAKCFQAKIWENSKFVSRQLSDIGTVRSKLLVDAEKNTFQSIMDSNPRDLERIMKRKAPFGDNIRDQIKSFPVYEMILIKKSQEHVVELKITLTNADQLHKSSEINDLMLLLVGDDQNNILLHEKYTHDYMKENLTIEKDIPFDEDTIHINANFICENKVGLDCVQIFEINSISNQKESSRPENANLTKRSASKQNKKVAVQKTMNNFFSVVKTRPEINSKKTVKSFNKENEPVNTNPSKDDQNVEDSSLKTMDEDTLQTAETSKTTKDLAKMKSKPITNYQDFFSDINQMILQNGKYIEGNKTKEKIPSPAEFVSNTDRSKQSTSKIGTSLSQVEALNVIQMLNKKFSENAKLKAKPKLYKYKTPTGTSSIKEFLTKYEASKNKLSAKKVAPIEKFENTIYKEISDEVPKKKKLTNEGAAIQVPDSTVSNNDFQYEVVVIEPEDNTERNGNSRNITWRSPLVDSSLEKHSPRKRILFNFPQGLKNSDSPATQSQLIINTGNPKSIEFRLSSPINNPQTEDTGLISSQNSFICPDLISLLRQEGQKDVDNLNSSANSSKSFYEQNLASNYYYSLRERSSPAKEAESQHIVTEDMAAQTNYEDLLEDGNDEFLQEVLLDSSVDNVQNVVDERLYENSTENECTTPKISSMSTKMSIKSLDFAEDDSKYGQVLEQPNTAANMQYVDPREVGFDLSFTNYPKVQDNYQLTQRNCGYPIEPINSPPRIQFDQLTRNYYDPSQTSAYFDRAHMSQRSSHRDILHNSQSCRHLPNQINATSQFVQPNYINREVPSLPNEIFLGGSNQFHCQGPPSYQENQNYNEYRMPYQKHNFISQNMYHSAAERFIPDNFRFTTQNHNWQRQAMIENEHRYRNQYLRSQPINRPSQTFGSFEQEMLHNQRFASNSIEQFNENYGGVNRFREGLQRQFEMPDMNTSQYSVSHYPEVTDVPSNYQTGHLTRIRRTYNPNQDFSRISNDQNSRRMEQGSQLMDALNPPEERDGKRIIFSRFMNSFDQ